MGDWTMSYLDSRNPLWLAMCGERCPLCRRERRLVLADWLEEHGAVDSARFHRDVADMLSSWDYSLSETESMCPRHKEKIHVAE